MASVRREARWGAALALVLAIGGGAGAARAADGPFFPPFGLDLTAIDAKTPAGTDFFQHVNGAWLDRTPIPADQTSISAGRMIFNRTEIQLHEMMDALAAAAPAAPAGSDDKVGAFYAAFMDEARVEALGATPIAPELAAIRAASSRAEIARLMGHGSEDFEGALFDVSVDVDLKDPAKYAVYLSQDGLGLPDRDYYLKPDFAAQRTAYTAYIAKLLTLAGWTDPQGAAARILALETRVAEASWTKAQQRDIANEYNPMSPAELAAFAPGFDWGAYLDGAKMGGRARVVIAEKSAFPKLAAIYAETPVETLQAWLAFSVADNAARFLSSPFQDAYFEFREKTLSGQPTQSPRWKRGVAAVSGPDCYTARQCFGTLRWAVGQAYVARYFTPQTKATMVDLVGHLKAAFRQRMEGLDWMGPATKAEALKKLDSYVIKVGYPDRPRDYAGVSIRRDDLVGDVLNAARGDWAFYVGRVDQPVDRGEWVMTPQTVDAYNGGLRDIVFPAAILQAPMFDPAAEMAVNYGAIGAVIGHEMTHGFDDAGRTIDAAGALRDWWTAADAAAFKARAGVLGAQYAKFEPAPGLHINPDLTMGENLADLGGLEIALTAYHMALGGKPAPVIDGLTGDQRFFLSFAQVWRGKAREDAIRQQAVSDPHSYRKFRTDGVVANIDEWYAAFDVKPGDPMWIAPKDRARIW